MHYKTNRLNHDFQIAYFIAGSCQTAGALKSFEAGKLREQAKIVRATRMLDSEDPATVLKGEADQPNLNKEP